MRILFAIFVLLAAVLVSAAPADPPVTTAHPPSAPSDDGTRYL